MLIGFMVAGQITEIYKTNGAEDWKMIWLIPAGIAFVVFLIFALLFNHEYYMLHKNDNIRDLIVIKEEE